MRRALERGEQQAIVVGTAVLFAAAAVSGAEEPPEVTEDQAKSAAVAFISMIARADMVVKEDRRAAGQMNMLNDLMDAVQGALEAQQAGKGDEAAPAANDEKEG